ncbi:MAG: sulfotransferase family protein [Chloroflexi bacterium]|nr:sulfotransferase family protein [Chloroflexota bacterium]
MTQNTQDYRSLVFVHIPKAAGTTLGRIIERQYSPRSLVGIDARPGPDVFADLTRLSQAQKSQIRCVMGKVPFGAHIHILPPWRYVTMMRKPVDRIISHYFYVLRTPLHYLHEQVVSRHMTLLDYATSGLSGELENDQTRLIAGRDPGDGGEMLRIAKANVREQFTVVGLLERFDESLLLMKKRLGWRNIYYVRECDEGPAGPGCNSGQSPRANCRSKLPPPKAVALNHCAWKARAYFSR